MYYGANNTKTSPISTVTPYGKPSRYRSVSGLQSESPSRSTQTDTSAIKDAQIYYEYKYTNKGVLKGKNYQRQLYIQP